MTRPHSCASTCAHAWREGYRGLIANDVIAARAARRRDEWSAHLARMGEREHVVVADLRNERFTSATLWVLAENNRARCFYEGAGWEPEGAERRHPERRALEIRYGLSNLC